MEIKMTVAENQDQIKRYTTRMNKPYGRSERKVVTKLKVPKLDLNLIFKFMS